MPSVQVHRLCFYWNSPQRLLMFHPNGNGLQIIEIWKPSQVYLKIIRGTHCHQPKLQQLHSYWNPLQESSTAVQLPNSQLQKQGCWGPQPCLSQHISNSSLTVWESSLWPTKRVKSLAVPTDSSRQREMPSLKCRWGVLQAGTLSWLNCSSAPLPPSGWHIQKKQQVGKVDVWGFHGVPLLLHKQKLLQCYILHHSQVAKESFPPH